jgi:hypothetical protein
MFSSKCNQETDHNSQTQWHNMLHVCVNSDDGNGDTIFRLKKSADPPNAAQKENPVTNITCRLKLETQGRTQEMHTAE